MIPEVLPSPGVLRLYLKPVLQMIRWWWLARGPGLSWGRDLTFQETGCAISQETSLWFSTQAHDLVLRYGPSHLAPGLEGSTGPCDASAPALAGGSWSCGWIGSSSLCWLTESLFELRAWGYSQGSSKHRRPSMGISAKLHDWHNAIEINGCSTSLFISNLCHNITPGPLSPKRWSSGQSWPLPW